jgi:hypothetical protein
MPASIEQLVRHWNGFQMCCVPTPWRRRAARRDGMFLGRSSGPRRQFRSVRVPMHCSRRDKPAFSPTQHARHLGGHERLACPLRCPPHRLWLRLYNPRLSRPGEATLDGGVSLWTRFLETVSRAFYADISIYRVANRPEMRQRGLLVRDEANGTLTGDSPWQKQRSA